MGSLLTQVHICSLGPVGAGHILEDGVQNLLLDLSDGVTVEELHWDLGVVDIVGVDTAQDLGAGGEETRGWGPGKSPEIPSSTRGPCPGQFRLCRWDSRGLGAGAVASESLPE